MSTLRRRSLSLVTFLQYSSSFLVFCFISFYGAMQSIHLVNLMETLSIHPSLLPYRFTRNLPHLCSTVNQDQIIPCEGHCHDSHKQKWKCNVCVKKVNRQTAGFSADLSNVGSSSSIPLELTTKMQSRLVEQK